MLSTKANTLDALSRHLTRSTINRLVAFTHADWLTDPSSCINRIQTQLSGLVAVRSSAINEDTLSVSNAGAFHSQLGVSSGSTEELTHAIDAVFHSYGSKSSHHDHNQVLVQEQSTDIVSSGVCTTRSLDDAPYYVITYADGADTAAVTSGGGSKIVKILRSSSGAPRAFHRLFEAVQEIEHLLTDKALDIEFGVTGSGAVLIFQVRALVLPSGRDPDLDAEIHRRVAQLQEQVTDLAQPQAGLSGNTTILGDMTDWNPAEMIGDRATSLAYSLYDELITGSVWSAARASQGYFDVGPRPLVHLVGNKPYVDVRCCFNSFLPADLPEDLRDKLVTFYLSKLQVDPALQDKVEFEILFTCYDPAFPNRAQELLDCGFSAEEVNTLRGSLLQLTNGLFHEDAIAADLQTTRGIDALIRNAPATSTIQDKLSLALRYLELCKKQGTLPFSRLARLAFISSAILKGFVPHPLSQEHYEAFFYSVHTVARDLQLDTERFTQGDLSAEEFLGRYGHLRPGTYDITSLRYDEQELQLSYHRPQPEVRDVVPPEVSKALWESLRDHGLKTGTLQLFTFARHALEAREEAKFHFTKLLSESLRLITEIGASIGLDRECLSFLTVEDLRRGIGIADEALKDLWTLAIESNRETHKLDSRIDLPPVIFGPKDLEVVIPFTSRPTYITQKSVTTDVVFLREGSKRQSVTGKIAVLERGDPGYDWIFTQDPAGLITKYGGAGSHMAIRCNEFSLPAAIGCGEELFRVALSGGPLTLDCKAKLLRSAAVSL